MIRIRTYFLVFSAICLAPQARAALKWQGCGDLADAQFELADIATRAKDMVSEPMKMAFDLLASPSQDAKGMVDVYFTERLGRVRKFDSKTGTVSTLASIPLQIDAGNSSDGVMGIALDPGFKSNHRLYLYYTYVSASEKSWRVSRFELNSAHTILDPASEIPVLKIPIRPGSKHPGGAMKFDAYGDLWIGTGNDYQDGSDYPLFSSPNTNDLRGKILRIHPKPDGTYSIPDGNLFAPGTARTKPEIYVMGSRNPYTLTLDPVRRWLLWGDIGPDTKDFNGDPMNSGGPEKTEEYDLAKAAGNYGYPFFAGDFATLPGTDVDAPAMPAGYDWEDAEPGLTTLPEAVPPIYAYKKSCAITGPLYRYDGDLNSSIKFPPHFHRKWLVTDFNDGYNKITAFTLNEEGTSITAQEEVLPGFPLHGPLDMEFGPDGALYVNNYAGNRNSTSATGIVRIGYKGDCRPGEPKLEQADGSPIVKGMVPARGLRVEILQGKRLAVSVAAEGRIDLEVRDLRGRPIASKSTYGQAPASLDEVRAPGIYFLRVRCEAGSRLIRIAKE
jgi:glucose/arabinose dehydrogenase